MRTRFVCDLLDGIERERGTDMVRVAAARVCFRMERGSDLAAIRAAQPGDSLAIEDAEQLLLGLDVLLGNGSGSVIESASLEVFSRLLRRSSLTIHGDLMSTMMRMRAPLEYPFIDIVVNWDLASSSTGFSLFLGVSQRPRTTRILKSMAVGAIRAAHRTINRSAENHVKIYGEVMADRATIDVQLKTPIESGQVVVVETAPSSFESGKYQRSRAPQPTLREVERILSRRR